MKSAHPLLDKIWKMRTRTVPVQRAVGPPRHRIPSDEGAGEGPGSAVYRQTTGSYMPRNKVSIDELTVLAVDYQVHFRVPSWEISDTCHQQVVTKSAEST